VAQLLLPANVNPAMYDAAMNSPSDLAAFILAGGKSTRMGTDKAFITFDGRTLLERALALARSVAPDVRIVGDPAKFAGFPPVVEDIFSGCGPLGGIHASLGASSSNLNLMLAVDMPFVTTGLLNYLIERARDSPATVTVPRSASGFQPLCAVYRRAFADAAQSALKQGRYKIDALFASESTQVISEDDLKAKGFSAEIFRNVNTPEELAEARSRGA
jgi:molybdenum cofactor guanylyltransferase